MSILPSIALLPAMSMLSIANGFDTKRADAIGKMKEGIDQMLMNNQNEIDQVTSDAESQGDIPSVKKIEAIQAKMKDFRVGTQKNDIDDVECRLNSFKKEMDSTKKSVKQFEEEMNGLFARSDGLDTTIADIKKDIAMNNKIGKKIKNKMKDVKANKKKIEKIQRDIESNDKSKELKEFGHKFSTINERLNVINNDFRKIVGKLSVIDKEFKEIEYKMNGIEKEIDENAVQIEERLDEIECGLNEKASRNHDHNGEITKNADDIGCLEDQFEILESEIDELKCKHTETSKEIENNKDDIDTNKNAISTNKNAIGKNKNEIGTNKKKIDTNRNEIRINKNEIDANKDKIGANKNEIGTNRNEISAMKDDTAELMAKTQCGRTCLYKTSFGGCNDKNECVQCTQDWHCRSGDCDKNLNLCRCTVGYDKNHCRFQDLRDLTSAYKVCTPSSSGPHCMDCISDAQCQSTYDDNSEQRYCGPDNGHPSLPKGACGPECYNRENYPDTGLNEVCMQKYNNDPLKNHCNYYCDYQTF